MDKNTSNISTIDGSYHDQFDLSPETRIGLIVLLGLCGVISVLANSMVLLTVYGNPRLRTNTNVFIANLCVVDLICGVVLIPLVIQSIGLQQHRTGIICEILGFLGSVYSSSSSLTIALIALDRYHSIVNCLYYENIVTRHRTILSIVFTWILTLVVATCPILGWGFYKYDKRQFKCALHLPDRHGFLWFTLCASIVFPYAVIVFCYTRIHLVARRHAKNMIAIHIHDTGKKIKAVSTTKTKLVYLVVGLFTICWIPIHLMELLQNVSIQIPGLLVTLGTLLSLINGSCNPFLYALITSQFRVGMRRLFKRIQRKFGQPVATQSGDQSKSSWSVSKPISNLYRYFQENDKGHMLRCIGRTTSEDFKMEIQGELGQRYLNRQMGESSQSKTPQTLQIPHKMKKTSDMKDSLEIPFLSDTNELRNNKGTPPKSSQYLDVIIQCPQSPITNGRLSVVLEESRDTNQK